MAPARVRLARLPGVVRKSFAAMGAVKEVGMAPGRLDKAKAPGCGHARLATYKGQIRANLGRRDATELTQARDLGSGLYGRNQSPPCVDPNVPSESQIASMRCSVGAGLSRSVVAVTASTSCQSGRVASPRPGISKSSSSWYGGRGAVTRCPIYSPFPSTPPRGPFGPSASAPAYYALC